MGGAERLGCTQPIHGLCCGWLFSGLRISLIRERYQKEYAIITLAGKWLLLRGG